MSRTKANDEQAARLPEPSVRRWLRQKLLTWYAANARDLPWRRRCDPYAVWLSEVMLQQTQVETVRGYFDRFLKKLPTVEALAAADQHEVLRLWEGLGYYRRARQLHEAAKMLVDQYGGQFPSDSKTIRRLPGIGRYTAGAILSIAFDRREPILEANTVRLFSRLLGYEGAPQSSEGQRLLWAAADVLLPRRDVGRFNQALMDLGSLVCTVRSPRCDVCPIATKCRANQLGKQETIPSPKIKPRRESVREAAVVVRRRGRLLLLRWPEGRRWAGLWDFPRFPISADSAIDREMAKNVLELTGATIRPGRRLATLSHGVTRFQITLECFEAECTACANRAAMETRWVRPAELKDFPLSSTGRKLARMVS
ncbi:MAG: A/G-specific adenine glycosylase [Planctomycetaceae bacterium]|nr:A/G-specific adenine glycosylase [Planctomycetaceae bacterium]